MSATATAVEQMRRQAERKIGPEIDRMVHGLVTVLAPMIEQAGKQFRRQMDMQLAELGIEHEAKGSQTS